MTSPTSTLPGASAGVSHPASAPAEAGGAAPGSRGDAAPVLVAANLTKSYGTVHAVRDVSLACLGGEVHALVGENGAGKSTVAKMLAGAVVPDTGSVRVGGEALSSGSVRTARRHGVQCAFQELALVPDWTVAENLCLPDGSSLRRFARGRETREAERVLAALDLEHIDPRRPVHEMPLADRQQVEIARAVSGDVKVLILDEASSALTPPGVEWLFARIRELTARGAAVVYVSHRLGEIREIADRGTVLRDGAVVSDFQRGSWTDDELISSMAGRTAARAFPPPPERVPTDAPAAHEVEGLSGEAIHDVALTVAPGEILGIGGLQGHGQAELLRSLWGAEPATARSWRVAGQAIRRLDPVRAVHAGIGFVPEDRKREGLALEMGVGENLLAPWTRPHERGGAPRLKREKGWIDEVLGGLSVRTRGAKERSGALTGGNQPTLVFGRWVGRDRKLVLLHDPTRGIDVRAKQELYDAIVALAREGVGVVWFSTEVEELVHVCHRVVVLYRGAVADELQGERLTADAVVGAAVGRRAAA
jgi:ribose transport system ATP-binding protein